jgi:hypothetical protein
MANPGPSPSEATPLEVLRYTAIGMTVVGVATWWSRRVPVHIRRTWPLLARGLGLAQTTLRRDGTKVEALPSIRLRRVRHGWRVTIKLLPGQTPDAIGTKSWKPSHTNGVPSTCR